MSKKNLRKLMVVSGLIGAPLLAIAGFSWFFSLSDEEQDNILKDQLFKK